MIERLSPTPPGTLGFRATGEIEPGELWADSKLGLALPWEARVFPRAELEQAKAWVAGDAG